jgi:molecular chaperone GrpE
LAADDLERLPMNQSDRDPATPVPGSDQAAANDPGAGDLEARLAEAEARAQEQRDAYLRAAADLENYRRRVVREIENARQYGAERLAGGLLPVVDSLELGLSNAGKADPATLAEGQEATLRLLQKALAEAGITVIDPAGRSFDPALHEAMATQPAAAHAPDTVLEVVQKGYVLNGRLLRPARVIVARAPDA